MIVKVNDKNQAEYKKLFLKASLYLGCPFEYKDNTITKEKAQIEDIIIDTSNTNYISDIYSYFSALQRIVTNDKDEDAPDFVPADWKYYTMVPIPGDTSNDLEPPIKINANTRAITIPAELKMLGIAGDNIAEIVFFEIDRFFDTMDFASLENIYIGWHKQNDTEMHKDLAYIREYSLNTGKLLIGWPITKEVTEEAGIIEFIVNFGQAAGDYNFSTLPAKANIGATLNLEDAAIDQEEQQALVASIKARIESQSSPGAGNGAVGQKPIIDSNIDSNDNVIIYSIDPTNPNDNYYADLIQVTTIDGEEVPSYTVTIDAHSQEGSQSIVYQWEAWNSEKGWWDKVDINTGKPLTNTATATGFSSLTNSCTITESGIYRCKVIDYLSSGFLSAQTISQTLYILGPKAPEVKICEDNAIGYVRAILDESEDGPTLSVLRNKIYANNAQSEPAWFDPTGYDDNGVTTYSYKWKYSKETSIDNIIDAEEDTGNITLKPIKEGYYYGSVIAHRNGKDVSSLNSTIWRVTKKAIGPTTAQYIWINPNIDEENDKQYFLGDTIKVQFKWNSGYDKYNFDSLIYQWYKYSAENRKYYAVKGASGNILGIYGTEEQEYPEIEFQPVESGFYVVCVKAMRNGTYSSEDLLQYEENIAIGPDELKGTKMPVGDPFVVSIR